jgi:hypothetical protein
MSLDLYQITLCYVPEDRTLHNYCCENLRSYKKTVQTEHQEILHVLYRYWQSQKICNTYFSTTQENHQYTGLFEKMRHFHIEFKCSNPLVRVMKTRELTFVSVFAVFRWKSYSSANMWFTNDANFLRISMLTSTICMYEPQKTHMKKWEHCYVLNNINNIWCVALLSHSIIGPVFLEHAVSAVYLLQVCEQFLPFIWGMVISSRKHFFQQDGTQLFLANAVLGVLSEHFHDQALFFYTFWL